MQEKSRHIDQKLLKACIKGDEKALHNLYQVCYGHLHAVCRRYLDNEDEINLLINNGFLKVVKGLKTYQQHIPFIAWIRRIMINAAIDYHRKHRKYRETIVYPDLDGEVDQRQNVDLNKADQIFDAEQLLVLIKKLPPMTSKVFNLYAIDGYSHKEIAKLLKMTEGTSKWHLSTARKKLQKMMVDHLSNQQGSRIKVSSRST